MRYPGLPDSVATELDRSGLDWHVRQRTNHDAIVVGGEIVTYFGRSQPGPRNERNMVAAVRRFVQGRAVNKYRKVS